jgi:hypothetical protein
VSPHPNDNQDPPKSGISVGDVVEYLHAHPDFLLDNPEVLSVITPPTHHAEGNVLDLQMFMLQQLQKEVRKLSGNWTELIATSRSNMATQTQIHSAVLAMLKSETEAELIHKICFDFTDILNVDAVALCAEDGAVLQADGDQSPVRYLERGSVDALMGPGRDILLRSKADRLDEVFGPAASLVRSDALIRLSFLDQRGCGVLALGARESEKFHPGQGTELMGFLARTVEICIGRWAAKA